MEWRWSVEMKKGSMEWLKGIGMTENSLGLSVMLVLKWRS
jgi:hypothetical protein